MNDPAVEPRPSFKPPSLSKRAQSTLSAVAASRRPTKPATPAARQKRANALLTALRWAGFGLLLSIAPIAAIAARDEMRPRLSHHILHGAAEIKRAPSGDQVRWRRSRTTVMVDSSIDRYGPRAREAVQSAFGTWLELGTHAPNLVFDTAHDTKFSLEPDGRNTVIVAPINLKGHEDDLAITLAFWDERTGSIAEADIVINAKVNFAVLDDDRDDRDHDRDDDHDHDHDRDYDGDHASDRRGSEDEANNVQQHRECFAGAYDLQNVLTHEVGHFMGLGEDMKDDQASMYFRSHRCETQKRTLAAPDETSVITLYNAPPDEDSPTRAAASCSINTAPASTGTATSLATFAGLAGLALLTLRRKR